MLWGAEKLVPAEYWCPYGRPTCFFSLHKMMHDINYSTIVCTKYMHCLMVGINGHRHTDTDTYTHTHIHVWGGFRGIGDLAAKLGTWILPHFLGVYSYDVPRNIAISRPKKCKKKLHNRYDFLPVTGEKIELSNNARGHPIHVACILPLDCLTSDFWIWGYPHCFWIPHSPEMICVCVPENPPYTYAHTHTHTHTHTHFLNTMAGGGGVALGIKVTFHKTLYLTGFSFCIFLVKRWIIKGHHNWLKYYQNTLRHWVWMSRFFLCPNSFYLTGFIHQLWHWGPVHIYVLGTQPRQNVLGPCSRYTSVHITSTVKCSRYPFVQVENGTHLGLRSMTYCVYTAQRVRSF